jgi:hypothetical protein
MMWTVWWRDGLPQPSDQEEFHAEGQRICFSEAGLAAFEAQFGSVILGRAAWRRAAGYDEDYGPARFARNGERSTSPLSAREPGNTF